MATRKLNVLVYSGNGSTVESVRHCLYTLRRLLAPNYAVIPVNGQMIIQEPWQATCALLVIPGGADMGYCRTLNGEGNQRIKQFVQRGGAYLGFCAGGYYGTRRCEFEVGNKTLEVIGPRELGFYPGTARGCAFKGFVYHSEKGARAVDLKVNKTALTTGTVPDIFKSYYNGGGVFVDAAKYQDQGVEVLASYTQELDVDPGEGAAAVVYCKVGEGRALLTGPHPEFVFPAKPADDWSLTKPRFAAVNLDKQAAGPEFSEVVEALAGDDKHRIDFLKACLTELGLTVNEESAVVPSLSRLHFSSVDPADTASLYDVLKDIVTTDDGEEYIKDENDTFHLEKAGTWEIGRLKGSLPAGQNETNDTTAPEEERFVDYNTVLKRIVIHKEDHPAPKETPYFNHAAFYASWQYYQEKAKEANGEFGKHIMYGEVVTSTNTLLEKNVKLLRCLPHGFTATATVQVAGRGRGSNVWVSPAGSLMFSTCVHHPMEKMTTSPAVFIQYLVAMAVVQAVKTYDKGYQDVPIKLKWPNDIYALDPAHPPHKKVYTKIGGILVNSHYNASTFYSVVGVGINTTNALPTTSLNALLPPLKKNLEPFSPERLLANILTTFEEMYTRFRRTGFDKTFEEIYYKEWLHMDQIVTVETEGGARARIKGITRDYGLLIAEELGWEDRPTGKRWELQSDSNSFDFFKGLIKRKV